MEPALYACAPCGPIPLTGKSHAVGNNSFSSFKREQSNAICWCVRGYICICVPGMHNILLVWKKCTSLCIYRGSFCAAYATFLMVSMCEARIAYDVYR